MQILFIYKKVMSASTPLDNKPSRKKNGRRREKKGNKNERKRSEKRREKIEKKGFGVGQD